jgi:hypothetical protein
MIGERSTRLSADSGVWRLRGRYCDAPMLLDEALSSVDAEER